MPYKEPSKRWCFGLFKKSNKRMQSENISHVMNSSMSRDINNERYGSYYRCKTCNHEIHLKQDFNMRIGFELTVAGNFSIWCDVCEADSDWVKIR